jgi:hypothetical protein
VIHTVPDSGLPTWPRPDPSAAQGPRLDPRLEVDVLKRQGEWAQVRCDNGWTAWVDGRLLLAPAPPPAPPSGPTGPASSPPSAPPSAFAPAPTAAPSPTATPASAGGLPLGLVAAAAIALASILPWLKGGGVTASAFKVPIKFLLDYKTTGSNSLSVGLLLLVLAAAGAALTLRPGMAAFARTAGGAAALVATVFVAQIQRALSSSPNGPSLFSSLGFGVFVALAGGVALAILAKRANTKAKVGA